MNYLRAWVAAYPLTTEQFHELAISRASTGSPAPYFERVGSRPAVVIAVSEQETGRVPVAYCVEAPAFGALLAGARAHHLKGLEAAM